MSRVSTIRAMAALAVSFVFHPGFAVAAPQILALMATDGPRPLECEGEICRAEFTAICLQEHRPVPNAGTVYELLPASKSTKETGEPVLIATMADGLTRRIDMAGARARFISMRGQFAMAIEIPKAVLDAMGAKAAGIAIAKTAILTPEPLQDDPQPITVGEIRAVLGRHVQIAHGFERDVAGGLATSRVLNALVNALPKAKRPRREDELAASERVLASYAAGPVGAERRASDDIRSIIVTCDMREMRAAYRTVRTCVQVYHDRIIAGVNTTYWRRAAKIT
ncbi:MAG: hypothetical protein ACKVSF_08660 [Alphaproteobacteria bacterium]